MAAPRPGPSSSSDPFLTGGGGGGGYEHHRQQQQQQIESSGHGGHSSGGGFASAVASASGCAAAVAPGSSSWFEQGGGGILAGGGFGGDGRGFGFGGNGGYEVSAGYNGCGEPGFAALSNAMSCGYTTPGLTMFSPMLYAGGQEGMALWQGGGLMPVVVPVGERKGGVRKREVEVEDGLMMAQQQQVDRGWGEDCQATTRGGLGGGGGYETSSGSEDSRSSSEKHGVVLLRRKRRRDKGGGAGGGSGGKKMKKAVATSDSPSEDLLRPDGGRKKRREMESPVPWTDDMVRFLFETYDDVHRRLWIESRGKVKNQKKWDPIIRTMQDKFGREFTKNQCESKYWKVRRECARFKSRSDKRAVTEPDDPNLMMNHGKGLGMPAPVAPAARDVMKPKFYDVWLEVAGNDPVKMPEIELSSGSGEEDCNGLMSPSGGGLDEEDVSPLDRHITTLDGAAAAVGAANARHAAAGGGSGSGSGGGGGTVREMKRFLSLHHEASEKREEDLNFKAQLTVEAVREHLKRMERRGSLIDDTRRAQLSMLQGVENKLDRLLNGLTALNGNIGAMVGRLATLPQR